LVLLPTLRLYRERCGSGIADTTTLYSAGKAESSA
jgi:hypothetical protein